MLAAWMTSEATARFCMFSQQVMDTFSGVLEPVIQSSFLSSHLEKGFYQNKWEPGQPSRSENPVELWSRRTGFQHHALDKR